MLERVALHQTRLHTPGIGLDAKGVALGARGIVLLASVERLVMLLSVYTRERSLEDLLPSLELHVVRSRLGTREWTFEVAAESSDRMDRIAEAARMVGGFTFTGTSRHFVQYRDASAPFGYDATELFSTDEALLLYHDRFTQTYDVERPVELRALLQRLMPRLDPRARDAPGPLVLVAEAGLGAALVHYLVRSQVEGEVGVAEWPPESAFDDGPVRRWIVRVPELPDRMRALVRETPGITAFAPAGHGVAVEVGTRHPVELRACPVFDEAGLTLIRRGGEPWVLPRLPPMGALTTFARVELRDAGGEAAVARAVGPAQPVRVALRLAPSTQPPRNVTAALVEPSQLPMLRRLAYALPRSVLARTTVATTSRGAFLRAPGGIESIPLGTFFVEVHPRLYVAAGHDVVPAVAPDVLARAIGAPASQVVFVDASARALAVEEAAFAPLEAALLDAPPWEPLEAEAIDRALEEAPLDLRVGPVGLLPARGVEPPEP